MTDTTTGRSWDITPADPDYSGPKITLYAQPNGCPMVARADDPKADPWVLIPVTLLQYTDQQAVRDNRDHDAAAAHNAALDVAFPDGPPGACGGYIDMPLTYDPDWDQCGAGTDRCPPERAGTMWYGDPVFMCPRCFENILGGPPRPEQMVVRPDGQIHD